MKTMIYRKLYLFLWVSAKPTDDQKRRLIRKVVCNTNVKYYSGRAMRDSKLKRRQILQAASELFIERGFDGMTYAALSRLSSSAIGSLLHFFADKAAIAAAVYDDASGTLIAECEAALNGYGRNTEEEIRALLIACLTWRKTHPDHWRLLAMLEANMLMARLTQCGRLQDRLGQMLEAWAEPEVRAGRIRAMPASKLYAVIMAPVMSLIGHTDSTAGADDMEWLELFMEIAMRMLVPAPNDTHSASKRASEKNRPKPAAPVETGGGQGNLSL